MTAGTPGSKAATQSFLRCSSCKKTLFRREFEENLWVCPSCGYHHRIGWRRRVEITFDPDSFEELDANLRSTDPLQFPEYQSKLQQAIERTGREDAVVCGFARLDGRRVSVAIADFNFMGGSMGSVSGEKIARTLERGAAERVPVIIFCASGGARMQEGLLSLMQMAKTVGAVSLCNAAGVPFIAVFTDPTMAGVLASYASVADVILAEPRALVGFAGARVSKQAQVIKAPDNFQTAEFAFKSGMIDRIVPRREIPMTLSLLVRTLGAKCA